MPTEPRPASAGRVLPIAAIVGAGVVVSLNVGKLPAALPLLREQFALSLVEASFLVSVFQLAGMLFGLFGGMLADRFGPRRVMRAGMVAIGAGGACGALAPDAMTLLASRALESAGFLLTVLPGPALLARHIGAARLRLAMGVWGAYMPSGMAAALVLGPPVLAAVGWRPLWVLIAFAALGWAVLLGRVVEPDPPRHAPLSSRSLVHDTLRTPRAWLLALGFGFYSAQWLGVFSFLPTLYAEAGLSLALAGLLTALGVVANAAGNLAGGALLYRGAPRGAVLAAAFATMLATAWAAFGSDAGFALRYAAVLAFSGVGGLIPATLFAATPAYAPHPRAVATTTGLMQQGSAAGQFASAPLVASVAAATGGWSSTWLATGPLAVAGLAVALAIAYVDRRRA